MFKKIAVIGLGSIAKRHRENLKYLFPKAKILTLSASGRVPIEKVEHCDKFLYSLQDLISEKPEFVVVASPASLHSFYAIPLLKQNIPTLIEKPVTITLSEAKELINLASKYTTPVAVGYCLRYLPSAQIIKKILDNNEIGSLYNIHIDVGQFLPDWRKERDYKESVSAQASLGGGALFELSHELDYIQWFLGEMDIQYAQLRNSSELNLKVEEIADLVMINKLGSLCYIHLDFLQKKAHRRCSFVGANGRIEWNLITNTIKLSNSIDEKYIYAEPKFDKNCMYLSMIDDFVALINGNENQCVNLSQAASTVALIDKIKQIAVWGRKQ